MCSQLTVTNGMSRKPPKPQWWATHHPQRTILITSAMLKKAGRTCVRVKKQVRDSNTGRRGEAGRRYFYFGTAAEHRTALAEAVRFRDGLWAEAAAGKTVHQLEKWAREWEDSEGEDEK